MCGTVSLRSPICSLLILLLLTLSISWQQPFCTCHYLLICLLQIMQLSLGLSERLLRGHPQRLAFRPRFGCTELQSSRCLTGSQHGRCIARCRNKPWRQSCGRQCSRHLVCSGRHGHKHCDVSGRRSRYRRKVARHCPWESMKPGPPGRCGPRDRTHAMQRAKR